MTITVKLSELANSFGYYSPIDMLENVALGDLVPAICMAEGCYYTTELEPDAANCSCEECGAHSVTSCLVLARLI